MKIQVLFAVLAGLVLFVNGTAVKPQTVTESAQVPESKEKVEATSAETFNLIVGIISQPCKLQYRGYYTKPDVVNKVQTEMFAYRSADPNVKICYISVLAVGSTSTAYAQIVRGGFNYNNVTIRLSSVLGYGYQFWVEIWGH